MSRYYYTDSLAAAWMAKHFGMKMEIYQKGKFKIQYIDGNCSDLEDVAFYIHPDSLHLLEPRVGDICEFNANDFSYTYIDRIEKFVDLAYNAGENIECVKSDCDPALFRKIIQRNGIPFMWPESE